jgi:hypothetical protein
MRSRGFLLTGSCSSLTALRGRHFGLGQEEYLEEAESLPITKRFFLAYRDPGLAKPKASAKKEAKSPSISEERESFLLRSLGFCLQKI